MFEFDLGLKFHLSTYFMYGLREGRRRGREKTRAPCDVVSPSLCSAFRYPISRTGTALPAGKKKEREKRKGEMRTVHFIVDLQAGVHLCTACDDGAVLRKKKGGEGKKGTEMKKQGSRSLRLPSLLYRDAVRQIARKKKKGGRKGRKKGGNEVTHTEIVVLWRNLLND